MLGVQRQVHDAIADAVRRHYGLSDVPAFAVEVPPNRALGDLAVTVAFQLARTLRKAPRAIAQELAAALPALPGVPTYAEAGLKPMNDMSWYGLGAPARLDPAILARLSEAMRKTLQKPELIKTIEQQGAVVDFQEPAQFRQTVERSNRAWSQLIRDIGFEKL